MKSTTTMDANEVLKFIFWNISGFNNFTNMDVNTRDIVLNSDVIALCETWMSSLDYPLPFFMNSFSKLCVSVAVKEKDRGRASGGLIMFVKSNLLNYFKVVSHTNLWICVSLNMFTLKYLILSVYISPNLDNKASLELLHEFITDLSYVYGDYKWVVLGDFNARIGQLNQLDRETITGYNVQATRVSLDHYINKRGKMVITLMEDVGLFTLNGRTEGDAPGNFTFANANGKSTIDLIWANMSAIQDVRYLRILPTLEKTEHSICILKLASSNINSNCQKHPQSSGDKLNQYNRLFWDELKGRDYETELRHSPNVYMHHTDPSALTINLENTIKCIAQKLSLVKVYNGQAHEKLREKQPWFNAECYEQRKQTKYFLKLYKLTPNNATLNDYLLHKKLYHKLLDKSKKVYYKNISNTLANVNNSSEFWKVVKNLKTSRENINEVTLEEWEEFYRRHHANLNSSVSLYFDVSNYYLDTPITLNELHNSIASAKLGKTPGFDLIPNEFYKHLPPNWEHYMLNMFNNIWELEKIPRSWSIIIITPIHKKGPKNDPANYRGIALTNSVTKLFTQILYNRIYNFVEESSILKEYQMGFRKTRGTSDNIFSLMAIIHIQLRLARNAVYVMFIDFKQAFDRINHNILWRKLYDNGISAKVIRMIESLYKNASLQVKVNNNLSNTIPITEGVLQGEKLSPILFSLFINDIESYFRAHGVRGLNIDQNNDILLIAYADDIALFSHSPIDLQKKINILYNYCKENSLTLNTNKTKIMKFQRNWTHSKTVKFYYDRDPLEVVNKFSYLGVTFTSTGKFNEATKEAKKKALVAIGNVKAILIKGKSSSWNEKFKLFHSVVQATALHGAETWAVFKPEGLEGILTKYLKDVLQCQKTTPNHMLRLETGARHVSNFVWARALNWWMKVLKQKPTSYTNLLYNRLKHLDSWEQNTAEYNWASQIRHFIENLGYGNTWLQQSHHMTKSSIRNVIDQHFTTLKSADIVTSTKFNDHYNKLQAMKHNYEMSAYLTFKVPIIKIRTVAQLRLAYKNGTRILIKNMLYKLDNINKCQVCNLNENENLIHFLFKCPIYQPIRVVYLKKYCIDEDDESNICHLLQVKDAAQLNCVYNYILNALRIRSFCLNE
uniref:Reverse transcriptase domain-containing protein n=1 Tax=Photinus pyralis TaxID=7054 RepID=A0A1Y1N802_PHOPY